MKKILGLLVLCLVVMGVSFGLTEDFVPTFTDESLTVQMNDFGTYFIKAANPEMLTPETKASFVLERIVPIGSETYEIQSLFGGFYGVFETIGKDDGIGDDAILVVNFGNDESAVFRLDILVPDRSTAKEATISMKIGDPMMTVNGESREIDPGRGTAPRIINGRTMVPVATIVEAIGGTVEWNGSDKTVTITRGRGDSFVIFTIDSTFVRVDIFAEEVDVAPTIINGRTYLPVSAMAKFLGGQVSWDSATQEVTLIFK